jgi:hypothetical protein
MLKRNLISAVPFLLMAAIGNIASAAEGWIRRPCVSYVSPKFVPKEYPVRTVLLLPAQVQLTKSGIKGKEGMAWESAAFAEQLMALIATQLEARNIKVVPNPFTEQALRENEELRATLTRLQNKYDTLAVQLHAKPKDVRKGRYSLGDEVATLGPGANADAIVFIRGIGRVVTGGKKALSLAAAVGGAVGGFPVGSPDGDSIRTFLTFANSKTGDVLAIVDFVRAGNFQEKTDQVMGKTLSNSLKKIPFSTN